VTGFGSALAHVSIDVGDGKYVMEMGFRDEPTYLGEPNALWLKVAKYATGGTQPVDDLASTLNAEVSKDGQTLNLPLVPMGDGVYEGIFVPTAPGDYTFHITGTIDGAPVDESATSGPSTFNSVERLSTIEFPVAQPDPAQMAAVASDAQAAASTARTLGIAGIVVGALGLIVAAAALARAGRAKPAAPAAEAVVVEPAGKLIR
jgi:hypothetical protein